MHCHYGPLQMNRLRGSTQFSFLKGLHVHLPESFREMRRGAWLEEEV